MRGLVAWGWGTGNDPGSVGAEEIQQSNLYGAGKRYFYGENSIRPAQIENGNGRRRHGWPTKW